MRFPSKEDTCAYIESYCNTNLSPMIRASSNKTTKSLLRMAFKCPQGMKRSSSSTGKRRVRASSFVGCPVRVNINQQGDDGTFVVTRADTEHENHEIGEEIFQKYVLNRRLSKDHEDAVRALLETDPSSKEVAYFLNDITGKKYSTKNANNIIKKIKNKY